MGGDGSGLMRVSWACTSVHRYLRVIVACKWPMHCINSVVISLEVGFKPGAVPHLYTFFWC